MILALTCAPVAEGLGFEPRVTCATMVFETIRFGRSRIPPGSGHGSRYGSTEEEVYRVRVIRRSAKKSRSS